MPEPDQDNKGSSIGAFLRETRIDRGLSLDDAARVTRIGKNYLSALEDDRFDILPNPAYARGFLRAYAEYLGLSGDDLIARYAGSGSRESHEAPEHKEMATPQVRGGSGASRQGLWVVPLILLLLVLASAYLFRDKDPVTEKAQNASLALPVITPVPLQQSLSSAAKPAANSAASSEIVGNLPADGDSFQGGVVLKLKVIQDGSLNITIDGTVSQQYDLKTGDLIEWKADRIIALDMGNAGGVEAEMNGRPLKPFGAAGKSAHVELKADSPPQ